AGRCHHAHRLAVVASTASEARAALAGNAHPGAVRGRVESGPAPKVAFVFPGQAPRDPDVARRLYQTQPTFRAALDRCDDLLRAAPRPSLLDRANHDRAVLFALEYALAELWQSWGVVPDVVLGHGVGEHVAACVSGALSLEEGLARARRATA